MISIHKVLWAEAFAKGDRVRVNEPESAMVDNEQVSAYVDAYRWGGPTSALLLHHLRELSQLIKPGDTIVDLACGPGTLLLELAKLYPDCHFIGVDLSKQMLEILLNEAHKNNLKNVSVLQEDITEIPSLKHRQVDVVISTSALHHLPNEELLQKTFTRLQTLLKRSGGFYFFDFGLLKSQRAQDLCVEDVARKVLPATAYDYKVSLAAAFDVKTVRQLARKELPISFKMSICGLFDFYYFIQSKPRTKASSQLQAVIKNMFQSLPLSLKIEHQLLRLTLRKSHYTQAEAQMNVIQEHEVLIH